MIVGAGFDPRAAVAYELISDAATIPVDLLRCGLPMPTLSETRALADANRARFDAAVTAAEAKVTDHNPEQTTGMSIARSVLGLGLVQGYEEVIVDVSAMPRGVYFPLLRGLLELFDRGEWTGDVHVVACDNPAVDELVTGEGVEAPRALP
ncbi:MAG: hypothetical protein M3355_08925, partial [Actinomycetota bacterium]|nr:hypothetical protein [Actinomycetota bacterium]